MRGSSADAGAHEARPNDGWDEPERRACGAQSVCGGGSERSCIPPGGAQARPPHAIARGDEGGPEAHEREADLRGHGAFAFADLQVGGAAGGRERHRCEQPAGPGGPAYPDHGGRAGGAVGVRAGQRFLHPQSADGADEGHAAGDERHRAGVCGHAGDDRHGLGRPRDHEGGGQDDPPPLGGTEERDGRFREGGGERQLRRAAGTADEAGLRRSDAVACDALASGAKLNSLP